MVHILEPESGKFVSQEHARVAKMISDYSADLSLVWIPPEQRRLDEQFPFAILHSPLGREPYIVRKVQLSDMNETLIAWLYQSERMGDLNAWADGQELAERMKKEALAAEQLEAEQDFMRSVLNGKNWYRHNGKVYS